MLLTITTTYNPATDLGYLLHKHPGKLQTFPLAFGQAHVFYPEAKTELCTAALLLDIDPIQLFRNQRGGSSGFALEQYVNDRPYVASSFLSVAIAQVYGSALSGQCKNRPDLVDRVMPLSAKISVLPCRGGEALLRRLFEPLGYTVQMERLPLDTKFPEWGDSHLFEVELAAEKRLCDLLTHLYVLIPVLDDDKHYYVGPDEVAKLMERGEGWLARHPERELIVERYLFHRRGLVASVLSRLREEDADAQESGEEQADAQVENLEQSVRLNDQRLELAVNQLKESGARRVLDLGCGEGKLIRLLLREKQFTEIVGMDVSSRSLANAETRLHLDRLPEAQRAKLKLIQGSLLYRDRRLEGFDAAVLLEVIEHLEPGRLEVMERALFGTAHPSTLIVTTPNQEYNRMWPSLPAGKMRHPDHHFEWTRAEFQAWSERVSQAFGYDVNLIPVGPEDPEAGSPTQMAVFTRVGRCSMNLAIPELSLVVLIGPSGSGKSTFARDHFKPTEVLSSDFCRALISDDANDQSVTEEAFDLLRTITGKRLAGARLTVIDATNVQPEARKPLVELAREYHAVAVAIVFDLPEVICQNRNRARLDRQIPAGALHRQLVQMRRSLRGLQKEGFRYIYTFEDVEQVESAVIERQPLWTDRKNEHGPFDIIGDLHGCCDELEALLAALGYTYEVTPTQGTYSRVYRHPEGRKAVFLGDLVDRGPRILDTFQLVRSMVLAGNALALPGNHDNKLLKKLNGRDVQVSHGMQQSLDELEALPDELRGQLKREMSDFLDGLISHYVLDGGKLVVAHAGMKASMQGRASSRVRDFALYGETTGETDEFGLPVRCSWASEYSGRARVVYGHTPVVKPEWLNNTINIDTGCVFGGSLTALRYPEMELVSIPAARVYAEPVRPLIPQPAGDLSAQQAQDELLDIDDIIGKHILETRLMGYVTIPEGNSATALEVMSRFIVNPKWLIYLPPTMSPPESTKQPGYLEYPSEAFAYFRKNGVQQVVCEQKHMGSRLVAVVCKDEEAVLRRFGIRNEGSGILYTRTGRRFFDDRAIETALIGQLQSALEASGFWQEFSDRLGLPGLRTDALVAQSPGTAATAVCDRRRGSQGLAGCSRACAANCRPKWLAG